MTELRADGLSGSEGAAVVDAGSAVGIGVEAVIIEELGRVDDVTAEG